MAKKSQESVFELRDRVKELETEVVSYKKRLDELRRAKNTTIVKKEREIIQMQPPNFGNRDVKSTLKKGDKPKSDDLKAAEVLSRIDQSQISQLNDRLKESERRRLKELDEMENLLELERNGRKDDMLRLRSTFGASRFDPSQLDNMQQKIVLLGRENETLRNKVETLYAELSIKEAKWCEKEESLTNRLRQSANSRPEWVRETEQKIEELQLANNYLSTVLTVQETGDI